MSLFALHSRVWPRCDLVHLTFCGVEACTGGNVDSKQSCMRRCNTVKWSFFTICDNVLFFRRPIVRQLGQIQNQVTFRNINKETVSTRTNSLFAKWGVWLGLPCTCPQQDFTNPSAIVNKAHKGVANTTETQRQNMSLTSSTDADAEPIITLLMGMFRIFAVCLIN